MKQISARSIVYIAEIAYRFQGEQGWRRSSSATRARTTQRRSPRALPELAGGSNLALDRDQPNDAVRLALAASPRGHGGTILTAAFSPEGTRNVTVSADKTARVWDTSALDHDDALKVACARLGNNTDLTDLAKRYGLKELKPICGDHKPAPVEWSMVVD